MVNHPNRNKTERAVLVTTSHRGVFFGYALDTDGETIKLRAARNCIYRPTDNKGFMGLAYMGPIKGSRVGPAADGAAWPGRRVVRAQLRLGFDLERRLHGGFVGR